MAGVEVIANQSISGTLSVADTTTLSTIVKASGDTDKFLVSDSGAVKYRTGAEVLSDIGAASTGSLAAYLPLAGGTMSGAITMPNNIGITWSTGSIRTESSILKLVGNNGIQLQDLTQIYFDGGDAPVSLDIHNAGTATGDDAKITFETQAAMDYAIGIDKSDSNKFKISRNENFGTNDVFSLQSGSAVIADALTLSTIDAIGSDTDKFLMSDSGVVKYVTGSNLRSYIGAGTGDGTVTGTGAANRIAYWSSSSALTSDTNFTFNGTTLGLTGDNDVLNIGTGGAGTTSLYAWTGDTFYIQNDSTGGAVQIETDSFIVKNSGAAETYISATDNGSVDLYYDNSKKIETTNTGVTITGGFSTSASSDCAGLNMTADIAMAGNDITLDTGAHIILDHTLGSGQASGTIIKYGGGILTAGKIYALYSTMGSTTWQAVNQTDSHAIDMLAISIGTSATSNGMLLSGILYKSSHGFTVGDPLYLASTDGDFTTTVPTTSNYYARVLGYAIDSSHIYFCPDNTWVKID